MTLRFTVDPALLLIVMVVLLALCGHGLYRAHRDRDGTAVSWWRRVVMVLMVGTIGATPAIMSESQEITSNAEIYVVVDRTGSMAAEDYSGTRPRLDGVRSDIVELTKAFAGSRFSVIGWDSTATRQLPLTTDARAVQTWAEQLRQEITWYSGGSAIDRPAEILEKVLIEAKERNPQNIRLLFFLSDGENTDGDLSSKDASPDAYRKLAPYVDGGSVLGYGTPSGGRMKVYSGFDNPSAVYIADSSGADAISRIDEANLRRLAGILGVQYHHRSSPGDLQFLSDSIDMDSILMDGRAEVMIYRDIYWPFVWILAILLAWEGFTQLRLLRLIGGEPRARS